ncbi:MAG: isopentenyl-diphosphate Delta-isomerase [Lachnospiraceae bacterium]|jgi:isopentenyl-diphosphate delta-isomerase
MNENLIWVDLLDQEIGSGEKLETHRKNQLHRAFSVFVINGNKMLIQKRAKGKYHSGGLWANACCSHPRKGETLLEAVPRRMKEELGICCDVKEVFSFVYFQQYEGLSEYEYDHVYLTEYAGEVHPDTEEIEEIRWIAIQDLQKELETHPEQFCAWFLIAAPRVLHLLCDQEG